MLHKKTQKDSDMDFKNVGTEIALDAIEAMVKLIASGEVWETVLRLVTEINSKDLEGKDKAEWVYREVKPLFFKGFSWFLKVIIQVAYNEMTQALKEQGRTAEV